MSRIKIKNFGPIKEGYQKNDGWIDVKKITVFIGNQASGKSSVAKLISTLRWIEKSLFRGDVNKSELKRKSKFQNYYCGYQNIKNYFLPDTEIEFEGDAYKFQYKNSRLDILENKKEYLVPKIMYVPSERNFVSVVSQPEKLKYLPKPLYTFLDEFERSKQELSSSIKLPINNLEFKYEKKKGISKVVGKDYEINLSEASSGLQSSIPLFIVSKNLAEGINKEDDNTQSKISLETMMKYRARFEKILMNKKITEELINSAFKVVSSIIKNSCFINIVEEPEQNLYPSSQRHILNSLLGFANINVGNKLIMTTHSPYIINYLSIAIQAGILKTKIKTKNLLEKLNDVVPVKSTIESSDIVFYQFDDNGSITKLPDYEGIPSDKNYLNKSLAEGNQLFDSLLEIEQEL